MSDDKNHIDCIAGAFTDAWSNSKKAKENEDALMTVIVKLEADRARLEKERDRYKDLLEYVLTYSNDVSSKVQISLQETGE